MRKPDFSSEYQERVLNVVLSNAINPDKQYWKDTVERVFEEAMIRYEENPTEYEPCWEYGYAVEDDAESLLEDYDDNGI